MAHILQTSPIPTPVPAPASANATTSTGTAAGSTASANSNSNAVKIGVGVGVSVGAVVIALAGLALFFFRRHRKHVRDSQLPEELESPSEKQDRGVYAGRDWRRPHEMYDEKPARELHGISTPVELAAPIGSELYGSDAKKNYF